MSQKSSTIAVINQDNKVLILRRGKTAPWMPGKYCLPGGIVQENESLVHAAVRELLEETNISCHVNDLWPNTIQYKNGRSKTVFSVKINQPIVLINWEHDDYVWVDSASVLKYDVVRGLRTTIYTILKKYVSN